MIYLVRIFLPSGAAIAFHLREKELNHFVSSFASFKCGDLSDSYIRLNNARDPHDLASIHIDLNQVAAFSHEIYRGEGEHGFVS